MWPTLGAQHEPSVNDHSTNDPNLVHGLPLPYRWSLATWYDIRPVVERRHGVLGCRVTFCREFSDSRFGLQTPAWSS